MPRHRRSETLPERLLERIKAGTLSEFFGRLHTIGGGGMAGSRCGFFRPLLPDGTKPRRGAPVDIQYVLKDGIVTRTEFLRGEPSIPLHIAHFDPETGKRFSTILDLY